MAHYACAEPVPAQDDLPRAVGLRWLHRLRRRRLPRDRTGSDAGLELRHRRHLLRRAARRRRAGRTALSASRRSTSACSRSCARCSPSASSTTRPGRRTSLRTTSPATRPSPTRPSEGGAVLLRNRGALPIDPQKVHSIAVIGPAANQYIHGNGSSQVTPYCRRPRSQGITARAAQAGIKVTYDDGNNPQTRRGAGARAQTSRSWSPPTPSPRASTSAACR